MRWRVRRNNHIVGSRFHCFSDASDQIYSLFLGLGGAKASLASIPNGLQGAQTGLDSETIMNISVSMGLALLVTAWMFYRISGGLFNPAVTLGLYLVGAIRPFRAIILFIAQIAGGIAGAGLLALLSPTGGISQVVTTLQPGVNKGQGLKIEAFLTAILVFCILMLAAEKHKATFLAPIGIGLTLFACQLMGTLETGCGMNPARAFGPSVIATEFVSYRRSLLLLMPPSANIRLQTGSTGLDHSSAVSWLQVFMYVKYPQRPMAADLRLDCRHS